MTVHRVVACVLLVSVATPAAAKPRRFRPAAIYAGLFQLHHAWRYRIEYTSHDGGTQRYTIRCSVVKVRGTSDAITSEVECTHGPERYEGLWLDRFLPDGTWSADQTGLSQPEMGLLIDASPVEISTAPDADGNPTHLDERRVGGRWCVPGPIGGSDEGPATQEVCFGASGVPETGEATGTAPERLTFDLAK